MESARCKINFNIYFYRNQSRTQKMMPILVRKNNEGSKKKQIVFSMII